MTIGGALSELINLLKADDIPFYYKPSIKAVMDTITLSKPQEPTLDKIRAEIEAEYTRFRNWSDRWCERANGLGTALEIIDKYKAESEDKK